MLEMCSSLRGSLHDVRDENPSRVTSFGCSRRWSLGTWLPEPTESPPPRPPEPSLAIPDVAHSVATRASDGTHVGLINMGSTPLRASAVEQALAQGASPADAAAHAAEGTEPAADLNASVEYREHLARVLVRRALETL